MDKIRFKITDIIPCEKSSYKIYDVTVILNDLTLLHKVFNASEVVPVSNYDFAEFDLFTCSCGVAGCAGFHNAVIQNKIEDIIKWTFPNDNSYKVEKLEYEFDILEFKQEFEILRKQMLALEKENAYISTCLDYADRYEDAEEGESFEIKFKLSEIFKWSDNRYKAEQNFNNVLKQEFPELHGKLFHFVYGNENKILSEMIDVTLDLNYLVCKALNQWPRVKKEKSYLKKVISVGKAIESLVYQKDNKAFIKLVDKSYKEFNQDPVKKDSYKTSFLSAFSYELRVNEETDLDISKIGLIVKE